MDLKNLIEQGEAAKGGRKALGEYLGIQPNTLTNCKGHRCPLPDFACVKLADLLGLPAIDVIAASALATEKHPERRAVWLPFVERHAKAASFAALALVTTFVTLPSESLANTGVQSSASSGIYIMRICNAGVTRNNSR